MQNSQPSNTPIAKRKSYTHRSTEQWRSLISESKQSPLSDKHFCLKNQIPTSSFYKWRKLFQQENHPSDFIDITATIDSPTQITDTAWQVELELGNGVILRVKAV